MPGTNYVPTRSGDYWIWESQFCSYAAGDWTRCRRADSDALPLADVAATPDLGRLGDHHS